MSSRYHGDDVRDAGAGKGASELTANKPKHPAYTSTSSRSFVFVCLHSCSSPHAQRHHRRNTYKKWKDALQNITKSESQTDVLKSSLRKKSDKGYYHLRISDHKDVDYVGSTRGSSSTISMPLILIRLTNELQFFIFDGDNCKDICG